MKTKIIFRADGNATIGMGHFTRTLALADLLKGYFECHYAIHDPSESQRIRIKQVCQSVITLEQEGNFSEFLEFLHGDEIVVIDSYKITSMDQKAVKDKGSKLVCIDDLRNKTFYADLIINHAPGLNPGQYEAQAYTTFALGPDYALLRSDFYQERKVVQEPGTAMICFGGSDIFNLTERWVNAFEEENHNFDKVIVVTGEAFTGQKTLHPKLAKSKLFHHFKNVSGSDMFDIMCSVHLAIVPASGILFEALAAGCKVISGYYIENQMDIYNGFKGLNAFIDAGRFSDGEISHALASSYLETNIVESFQQSPRNLLELFINLRTC